MPFFSKPEFFHSLPKTFELVVYIVAEGHALANQSINDYIPIPEALNYKELVYVDDEAKEVDSEWSSLEHITTLSSCFGSSRNSHSNAKADYC